MLRLEIDRSERGCRNRVAVRRNVRRWTEEPAGRKTEKEFLGESLIGAKSWAW
jgi:hypothetical protein